MPKVTNGNTTISALAACLRRCSEELTTLRTEQRLLRGPHGDLAHQCNEQHQRDASERWWRCLERLSDSEPNERASLVILATVTLELNDRQLRTIDPAAGRCRCGNWPWSWRTAFCAIRCSHERTHILGGADPRAASGARIRGVFRMTPFNTALVLAIWVGIVIGCFVLFEHWVAIQ